MNDVNLYMSNDFAGLKFKHNEKDKKQTIEFKNLF